MQAIPYPRIIFFIAGSAATDEEYLASLEFGPGVIYRHRGYAGQERPELADAVAGDVPDNYRNYPSPEQAIKKYQRAVDDLRNRVQTKRDLAAGIKAEPTTAPDGAGGVQQTISPGTPGAIGASWNKPEIRPLNEQPLAVDPADDPRAVTQTFAKPAGIVPPTEAPPVAPVAPIVPPPVPSGALDGVPAPADAVPPPDADAIVAPPIGEPPAAPSKPAKAK